MSNKYDNVQLNIPQLLADQKGRLTTAPSWHTSWVGHLPGRLSLIAGLQRLGLIRRAVYSNLVLGWFDEFNAYWTRRLGLRPLTPPDFWFLYGIYRQRWQFASLPVNEIASGHAEAWQASETIFLIFQYQIQVAVNPAAVWSYRSNLKSGSKVLEYGCGLAPISTSILRCGPYCDVMLADVPNLLWDFVQWKFCKNKQVQFFELSFGCDQALPRESYYDVIFCKQVLEHVLEPLAVVKDINRSLRGGGYWC